MYDMLFCFPDEATAHAVLDPFGLGFPARSDGEGGMWLASWDTSTCLPVTLSVGEQKVGEDENGQAIMAPIRDPRFWIVVSVAQPDDDLYAIPYCMREANRDIALSNAVRQQDYENLMATVRKAREYGMEVQDPDPSLYPPPESYVTRERFTAEQLSHPWTISPQWAGVDYSNPGANE